MEFATIGGLIFTFLVMLIWGIGFTKVPLFIDIPSVAIVVGGTIGSIFISFPMKRLMGFGGVLKQCFIPPTTNPQAIITQVVQFAEQARREGILSLEARSHEIKDEFLKKGIQLAVDGTEPDLIKDILSTEISFIEDRHSKNIEVFSSAANLGPAYGMLGTLIGLVLMLVNLSDPSTLGPAMAVALITTFYGSLIANVFFMPFETKLKQYNAEEILEKTLMLEGIMALQSGDNPRIVEQKLSAFLDPATRLKILKKDGGKT